MSIFEAETDLVSFVMLPILKRCYDCSLGIFRSKKLRILPAYHFPITTTSLNSWHFA